MTAIAHAWPAAVAPRRLVLLGHPVAHSLSPTFQNAALLAAKLALRYEALDVDPDALPRVLGELRAEGGAGNVTVPHKTAVADACDALTDVARAAGAVNTFWHAADGRLIGDNTDVAGAAAALAAIRLGTAEARAPRIAVLGAGGAAAALVLAAVRVWPAARVRVWARRPGQAATLAERFPGHVERAPTSEAALDSAALVVNATPLGLGVDDPLPCDVTALPRRAAVFDLVYGAKETAWVRAARGAGHDAHDGLAMLVEQGAAAFSRWFAVEPDRARMWAAVEARTGRTRPVASAR